MNIVDGLREQARLWPQAVALADDSGRSVTFGELDLDASRVAATLRALGLRAADGEGPGDAVLILQPVSIELYRILLGVLRARLTAMFVDPGAGRAGIAAACALVPPRALVGSTAACMLRWAVPALRRVPVVRSTRSLGRLAGHATGTQRTIDDEACAPETPALITFTSGSTGEPKVAVRSHGFLLAQHRALEPVLALEPGDRVATSFPVFVLSHLGSGASTFLGSPRLRRGLSAIVAAPAWCDEWAAVNSAPDASLRRIVTGGGPVFSPLRDVLRARAPRATVTTLYGSTEAEPIAHIDDGEITAHDARDMREGRGLLVGAPVDTIELRVLRKDFAAAQATRAELEAATVASGTPGEIVVSGEHVLRGYYRGRRDEETKVKVDGAVWHRTGDAGFVDEHGRVWLLGRLSARIDDAKGTLYPFQVEAAAAAEPGVHRSALVARDGKRILLVELDAGADGSTLTRLEQRLAWASVEHFIPCRRIPTDRRHHSKIDYPALAKLRIP